MNFTEYENDKLKKHSAILSKELKNSFAIKYSTWKNTWNDPAVHIHSSPRKYAESEAYKELLKDCITEGKPILPLVIQKLDEGDYFVRNLLEDLTFGEYEYLMDEVRNERKNNLYDEKGVFIFVTSLSGWKSYVKKLILVTDFKGLFKNVNNQENGYGNFIETVPENFSVLTNYPNPFNPETAIQFRLEIDSKVTLKIYDIMGREVVSLLNAEHRTKGSHSVKWNGLNNINSQVASGIYFCQLITNNKVHVRKIMFMQ